MLRLMAPAIAALCLVGSSTFVAAAEPIATTDGETPGTTLQVRELKVNSGTVMLKFTIVNNGDTAFNPDTIADTTVKSPDYHSISGLYLLDVANKKKYLVMYDSAGLCVCSRQSENLAPKASANMWAKFPAPPDSVQKIGIVVPHFVPLDDVPLGR